jgi:hypothetical protein
MRVMKPGGRLTIVDPDHDTHILDTPYPDVTHLFSAFAVTVYDNPALHINSTPSLSRAYAFSKRDKDKTCKAASG